MAVGAYTVHYRQKGDPKGKTNQRLCETPDEALRVALDLMSKGGSIAFIQKGTAVWMTGEQVKAKVKKDA